MIAQFARHMTTLRPGRGFARAASAAEHLGDIGYTDKQRRRDPAHGQTRVRRHEHAFTQILRVGSASPPQHGNLR